MMILVTLIIAMAIYLNMFYRRKNEPPMLLGALPFIGHAHYMLGHTKNLWQRLEQLGEKSLTMGHPFFIKLFNMKVYVLSNPDDCYAVAQKCLDKPRQMNEFSRDLLGDGLITNESCTWFRHRKLMNPMFHKHVVEGFLGLFNTNAKNLVAELATVEGKGFFDHLVFMRKTSMNAALSTLTGEMPCNNDILLDKYIDAMEVMKGAIIQRVAKFWLFFDFIYKWTNLKKKQDATFAIMKNETVELFHKMKKLRLHKIHQGLNANSFMEFFAQLENNGLSKTEIVDEANTLILASFDTSTLLFSYLMVVIGSYPDVQERLYEELIKHVSYDVKNEFEINEVNISKLTLMEAVIKETIRIYTIVPIVSRHLDRNINLKNYTLYKGNECILLCNALHLHPMWGEDVREFKPERWLNPESTLLNPHLFAGFGLGRRNCIGKVYAMMQTKVILSHVLLNYKISGCRKKIVLKYKFGLEPDSGHHISIERRKPIKAR